MKRIILALTMLVAMVATASAQAEIKFEKVVHNFGTFEETAPVQKAVFTFTNVGNKPLVINQAIASCGCTVPSYTKQPIAPGQKGQISVTYNGQGYVPWSFQEEHHRSYQWQCRDVAHLYRGRDEREEVSLI